MIRQQPCSVVSGFIGNGETSAHDDDLHLWWLGQAGFALRRGGFKLLIDPYLSDFLATKYRGREFPHIRMMPPPVEPDAVNGLDFVLCTHAHSDHMDPGGLPTLVKGNPDCRFVVPRAERNVAIERGVPEEQLVLINACEENALSGGVSLKAIASAHEDLKTDTDGNHHYLGYILEWDGIRIYHGGDGVPYDGLAAALKEAADRIDLMLLPVNGRDAFRRSRGVPGNFTFEESAELCRAVGSRHFIPHHFGMFDFNTADEEELRKKALAEAPNTECIVPEVGIEYVLSV